MRIIVNEIRKIFSFKIVGIAIVGCTLLFAIFPMYNIKNFPDGYEAKATLRIFKELNSRYGNTLSLDEEKDFNDNYIREKEQSVDSYISNNEEAKKLGINSYKDLKKSLAESKEKNEESEIEKLYSKMVFEEYAEELWDITGVYSIQREKLSSETRNINEYKEEKNRVRYEKIINRDQPIITEVITENFDRYIEGIGMIVIFAVMIFLGTIFIKDRKEKVVYLQYTSKIGRRIISKKVVAAIISTIIITTIIIGISIAIYFTKCGTTEFLNVDINSIFNNDYKIDITYLQFIILKIIILYVVGLVTSIIALFISKISRSYLMVLAIGVPIFSVLSFITKDIILNGFLKLYINQRIICGTLGGLVLVGIFMYMGLKDKKKDILE